MPRQQHINKLNTLLARLTAVLVKGRSTRSKVIGSTGQPKAMDEE